MTLTPEKMSASQKAHHTAKWARTDDEVARHIQSAHGSQMELGGFRGQGEGRSSRYCGPDRDCKDHRHDGPGLKRGDLFDIVLIQTKGGSASRPTPDDLARLSRVARHHRAQAVILAEWRRAEKLELFKLSGKRWEPVSPDDVFG